MVEAVPSVEWERISCQFWKNTMPSVMECL